MLFMDLIKQIINQNQKIPPEVTVGAKINVMNQNQREILNYLKGVESATIDEIYANTSTKYYHNYAKYVGERMTKLVRSGHVVRIKQGVFKIAKITSVDNSSQQKLF